MPRTTPQPTPSCHSYRKMFTLGFRFNIDDIYKLGGSLSESRHLPPYRNGQKKWKETMPGRTYLNAFFKSQIKNLAKKLTNNILSTVT
ncbi:hypothetical protein AVEN_119321-1 [Araneus ventricosus]|uniref:Uncharacterized protein n=1 Tax=Araneus ventricosus TaxID=182803 RepID=A0A4Y2TV77_ARAVE|nr:hypothetical protein AVEN_119321-1 [Araneus ventricosus]